MRMHPIRSMDDFRREFLPRTYRRLHKGGEKPGGFGARLARSLLRGLRRRVRRG